MRIYKPKPREVKFWRLVTKTEACWLWAGECDRDGYGKIREQVNLRKKWIKAHRVSWEIHNGPIPPNTMVLHDCDNPPCCNPAHLYLGDVKRNAEDAVRRGRMATGEKHGMAKLTWAQVTDIRALRSSHTQGYLARKFGVAGSMISRILAKKNWKDTPPTTE